MSASFLHYLVEDKGVAISSIVKFYRLMWSRPDSRWQPPLMDEINKLDLVAKRGIGLSRR